MRRHRRSEDRRLRIAAAIVLVAGALAWPFLNLGPKGPTLVFLSENHGIDAVDLLGLIPLVLAVVVLFRRPPVRKRPHRPM